MSDGKLFLTCQTCGMLMGCNNGQSCEDCPPGKVLQCVTTYDEERERSKYVAIITETCDYCSVGSVANGEMPAMLSD